MQKIWRKINKSFLFLVFGLIFFTQCEEYNEGCMDANASNYSFANEKPCCCTYPNLIFQTTMKFEDRVFTTTDTLETDQGEAYVVNDLKFISSDIILVEDDLTENKPSDSLQSYQVSPDLLPVHIRKINNQGSIYLPTDSIQQLSFKIQDNADLNQFRPEDFPIDHSFRDSSLYNFEAENWRYFYLVIKPIDSTAIILNFSPEELNLSAKIEGRWSKTRGENLIIPFSIYFDKLLQGIDFNMTTEEIKAIILANFSESVKI